MDTGNLCFIPYMYTLVQVWNNKCIIQCQQGLPVKQFPRFTDDTDTFSNYFADERNKWGPDQITINNDSIMTEILSQSLP